jgi:hypothetical protein
MSYNVCFWRERPGPRKDPRAVYDALLDEQEVSAWDRDRGRNRLVDIAANFGAPLYDPQTGERFDSWIDA